MWATGWSKSCPTRPVLYDLLMDAGAFRHRNLMGLCAMLDGPASSTDCRHARSSPPARPPSSPARGLLPAGQALVDFVVQVEHGDLDLDVCGEGPGAGASSRGAGRRARCPHRAGPSARSPPSPASSTPRLQFCRSCCSRPAQETGAVGQRPRRGRRQGVRYGRAGRVMPSPTTPAL